METNPEMAAYVNQVQQQVSFKEAVVRYFQNYANFNGRASRSEYWWVALFNAVVGIALIALPVLSWIYSAAIIVPNLALSWRRLHDIGRAGGWWFIGLIPLVGWIIMIIWCCTPSEPQANRFGEIPNMPIEA